MLSFWFKFQCKNYISIFQLWGPHIEDLGTCEDGIACGGFNISDVDLSFENYEDIFSSSHLQSSEFEDLVSVCSSIGKRGAFAEPSCHMESIPEGNAVNSENVSAVLLFPFDQ